MDKKIRTIAETAVMLALLVALQAVTKPMGQFVTGSCVNAVLAIAVLVGGMGCGVVVAVVSPVAAYLLGIAPQILTVPAIMVGNAVFVVCLRLMSTKLPTIWGKVLAWLCAAVCKFLALYLIVVQGICGIASSALMESGALKQPMIAVLSVNFGVMQLVTALIGGALALAIAPIIRKALHR